MTDFKENVQISPEPLALRAIERRDIPSLRAWKNDPSGRRWVGDGARTFSEADMERWFDRTESLIDRERRWIVEERGHPVGFVGLYGIDPVRGHAEVGILLDPEARGRGIGGEATRLLLDEAFNVFNLHRLFIHVLADHRIARNIYKSSGFQEEGRLRQQNFKAGRYVDVIVMGVLAGEHAARDREERGGRPPR